MVDVHKKECANNELKKRIDASKRIIASCAQILSYKSKPASLSQHNSLRSIAVPSESSIQDEPSLNPYKSRNSESGTSTLIHEKFSKNPESEKVVEFALRVSNSTKKYYTTPEEFYGAVDIKFARNLIGLAKGEKPKSAKFRQPLRVPSNPFCGSCKKGNKTFLENGRFVQLNESGSGLRVIMDKEQFVDRIRDGYGLL